MTDDTSTIFGRCFSQHDQRKLGCWAFVMCLVIGVTICNVFEPYILNLKLLTGDRFNMLMGITKETIEEPHQSYSGTKELKLDCNLTRERADFCDMIGDIRIHGNSSTIFIASTQDENLDDKQHSWNIKPYARKEDSIAMGRVRTITIKTEKVAKGIPNCSRNYNNPAIVFSTGGYARNHFHAFSDLLIPLFLTSIEFKGEVWFLITDIRTLWIEKHQEVLQKLSKYQLIDIDQESEVLCFPRIILGLKATDKELGINSSQSSHTMKEFRQFLRNTYFLKRESVNKFIKDVKGKRPRLLVISRATTRRLLNEGEIAVMAESLGFDVVVKDLNSTEFVVPELVNSVDVFLGVHGAGLTNMVFLPENAVVIQIIPLGEMEWMARTFYEEPTRNMNMQYLEYKISPDESTLTQQFPDDPEIFKDAESVKEKGWRAFRSIFMDKQDINLNVSRFRNILLKAHEFLQS